MCENRTFVLIANLEKKRIDLLTRVLFEDMCRSESELLDNDLPWVAVMNNVGGLLSS
jgi:hypothetical protein